MTDFQLIRNADVKVVHHINHKKQSEAEVIINGEWSHQFPATSRVSSHLDMMSAQDLQDRMQGGQFFMVEDQLVDWRYGDYSGFTHTDQTISKFMDVLGYQSVKDATARWKGKSPTGGDIILSKVWTTSEIEVPNIMKVGTDFTTRLSFDWNPFVKTINSHFDIMRVICLNGHVGLTSFLNSKVPVINRWEEHLDIAARQIQNKVHSVTVDRVQAMVKERASIADCLLLEQHVYDRLHAGGAKPEGERTQLLNLLAAVSPAAHLSETYLPGVFLDKTLASQLPAHLSNFDVYNVSTEIRSHTQPCAKSSNVAMDRFANVVMFGNDDRTVRQSSGQQTVSAFENAERAYFGVLS